MMNLKHTTIKTRKRQAGLTLLELTVVLLVLIGLSGLILPYAQGYLQRTHDSTGNDNLWELNNAIGLFQAKYNEQPDGFHSLINSSGAVYTKLMNVSLVAPRTYTAGTNKKPLKSLKMAGIDDVWVMKTSPASATFDAITTPIKTIPMPNGSGSVTLAIVTIETGSFASKEEHLAYAFYNNTAKKTEFDTNCFDYVVFGVGPEREMVGHTIADAPLHFASAGGMGPDKKYNRFVAVYAVQKATGTVGSSDCGEDIRPAKFIGSAMLMGQKHLWGLAHTQAHTYENMTNKNF